MDLYKDNEPATGLNGSQDDHSISNYEEYKFGQHAVDIIKTHNPDIPLFLNYDFHIVHEPLQVCTIYILHITRETEKKE